MSEMISSMLLGLFCLVSVFTIILFLTVGFKYFLSSLKQKTIIKQEVQKPNPKKSPQPRKRKPVKSIVIDPDDVDRIYVKKSS